MSAANRIDESSLTTWICPTQVSGAVIPLSLSGFLNFDGGYGSPGGSPWAIVRRICPGQLGSWLKHGRERCGSFLTASYGDLHDARRFHRSRAAVADPARKTPHSAELGLLGVANRFDGTTWIAVIQANGPLLSELAN